MSVYTNKVCVGGGGGGEEKKRDDKFNTEYIEHLVQVMHH